jgi:hypothetical protein
MENRGKSSRQPYLIVGLLTVRGLALGKYGNHNWQRLDFKTLADHF